jgi:hypothetical protein
VAIPVRRRNVDPVVAHERAVKAAQARTSPRYHLSRVRDLVEASRAAQGLPTTVVDHLTLGQVATLIEGGGPNGEAA